MSSDYSPSYAAGVALLNAILAGLSAFGVFQVTAVQKDALTGIFAAAFVVAVLLIPVFVHRSAMAEAEAKRWRR